MTQLRLVVYAPAELEPTSPAVLALVNETAARVATVWTEPVYVETIRQVPAIEASEYGAPGIVIHRFITDAQPKP